VKLYADEEGSGIVRALDTVLVSAIARVDVPAAMWRKVRTRQLDPESARTLVASFEADWFGTEDEEPRFAIVALLPAVLDVAARLTAVHGLRAYDAVQLASAATARGADESLSTFVCFDDALRDAAAAEGFETT
jgi:hypothetical protein